MPIGFPTNEDNNDQLDVLSVDFLVRTYLLQEVVPHPVPNELEQEEPQTIALLSRKWFGCDARYACLTRDLWNARIPHR